MFLQRYNTVAKRNTLSGPEGSLYGNQRVIWKALQIDNVEWRCMIMSTVIVTAAFVGVLVAKWNFYNKYYTHKK